MNDGVQPLKIRSAAFTCVIVLLAWGPSVFADEFSTTGTMPEDCLTRASLMINPGEALTIQLFDGRRIDGKLVSFDLEKRLVTMEKWDELCAEQRQVEAEDIRHYEYSERSGKGGGVTGAILGAAIGAVVGVSVTSNDNEFMSGIDGAVGGMFIGGGVGYAVGSNLNSGYRPPGTIICGDE